MGNQIICEQLSKKFDKVYALNAFDMKLEKNKIYGLIGRNGAGKTTLLKLLAKQLFPTKGDIDLQLNKKDDVCLAREVMTNKTVIEYKVKDIMHMASLSYYNWDESLKERLVEAYDLDIHKKYRKLSKGMQTMVGIIIGLSSRAAVTLLDEPYVGLDPVGRHLFYQFLREDYEAYPRTFIISTHLMNELQTMFEEVILIDKGKAIFHKTMDEIGDMSYTIEGREEDVKKATQHKHMIATEKVGRLMIAYVMDHFTEDDRQHIKALDVNISGMDLQTLFVKLTTSRKGE
ncbi:ATP-binding cassette domain-containing protein [Vallitalea pronyensis]|nr:ABC transporter ATP-binding protein [Vallitalea pronyensis]